MYDPWIMARMMQEMAVMNVRATRTFHVGIVTSNSRKPDVKFGDASAIKEVPDMNSVIKGGWMIGGQVMGAMVNGDPNNVAVFGPSPYLIGEVTEV